MCLGIPGRILDVDDQGPLRMGRVSFDGVLKEVCLACVPEAGPGDYVVVHAGYAIGQVRAEEAEQTLELLRGGGS